MSEQQLSFSGTVVKSKDGVYSLGEYDKFSILKFSVKLDSHKVTVDGGVIQTAPTIYLSANIDNKNTRLQNKQTWQDENGIPLFLKEGKRIHVEGTYVAKPEKGEPQDYSSVKWVNINANINGLQQIKSSTGFNLCTGKGRVVKVTAAFGGFIIVIEERYRSNIKENIWANRYIRLFYVSDVPPPSTAYLRFVGFLTRSIFKVPDNLSEESKKAFTQPVIYATSVIW